VTSISDKVNFNHLEGYLAAPPAIDEGFLYMSSGSGAVHKLESESGEIVWTYDDVGGFINNTPVLTEDSVIIIGSQGKLVALDKETGEKKWERPQEPETEWSLGSKKLGMPSVTGCLGYDPLNKIIIMGDVQGRVFGVSPQDGSLIWMRELKAKIIANPQFKENAVFIATMGGRLHSLYMHDGSDYWKVPRVKVAGIEGSIRVEEIAEEMTSERNYFIKLKYKYNFAADDYFGPEEKSTFEIVLLDENKLPIMFKEEEEETDSIVIEEIDPGEHIVPGSQTQEKEIQLAGSPGKEKNCPITVVMKDSEGSIIDTLETEVSFILAEEKKEQ
jgi:outer membrane protein assembly factor BamB